MLVNGRSPWLLWIAGPRPLDEVRLTKAHQLRALVGMDFAKGATHPADPLRGIIVVSTIGGRGRGGSSAAISAFAEADQREMPKRRNRAPFDQLHAVRTFRPAREHRPGKVGTPAEPPGQRRHRLFDPSTQ